MHREIRVSNYILAAFSALSLILLSLPLSAPVRAFKACAVYAFNPVVFYGAKGAQRLADVPPGLARLLNADMENIRLKEQLREALWHKAELEALRADHQRLAQALALPAPAGRAPIWADVMERDPLHWYSSLMVGAGSRQGVALNAPVLGEKDGTLVAIGRVAEVRPDASVVLLLTDELSSVAAYLSSAAAEGLAQGQGGPRLRLNYLPAEALLSRGDLVYTSPTSATFPSDILLGRVTSVNARDAFLTFQSVEVRPFVDASSLSRVMILRLGGAASGRAISSGTAPGSPAQPAGAKP